MLPLRAAAGFPGAAACIGLLAMAFAGCGNEGAVPASDPADSATAYREVLAGLRQAADSNSAYDELERAERLEAAQRAVIDALCDTAWQLVVNDEADLLSMDGFIGPRISGRARALNGYSYVGIGKAMDELRKFVDLAAYDPATNRRYKKACGL